MTRALSRLTGFASHAFRLTLVATIVILLAVPGYHAITISFDALFGTWPLRSGQWISIKPVVSAIAVTIVLACLAVIPILISSRSTHLVRNSQATADRKRNLRLRCQYDECGTLNPPIQVWCSGCRRFLYELEKRQLATLGVALTADVILFRYGHAIWPIYFLIGLGIIHLYAVTFSRGDALASASLFATVGTTLWALWEVGAWLSRTNKYSDNVLASRVRDLQQNVSPHTHWIALALWIGGTVWAAGLGHTRALPGLELSSSYFLGTGAFVFGLWGTWGVFVEHGHSYEQLYASIVLLVLIVPLVILIALLRNEDPHAPVEGRRTYVTSLWLFAFAGYSICSFVLTKLVSKGLNDFIPRSLGLQPIQNDEFDWLDRILKQNVNITIVLCFFAGASTLASTIAQTRSSFRAPTPAVYIRGRESANRLLERSRKSSESRSDLMKSLILGIEGTILGLACDTGLLLVRLAYSVKSNVVAFAENMVSMLLQFRVYVFKLIRFLLIPACSFSFLSASSIITVVSLRNYLTGASEPSARQLWAQFLVVGIAALILCGVSFGFAPAGKNENLFAGTNVAVHLGVLAYLALSALVSFAFLLFPFGFDWLGHDASIVKAGRLFYLNGAAAALLIVSILIALWIGSRPALLTSERREAGSMVIIIVPIAVFAVLIAVWGIVPLQHGLRVAAGY